MKRIFIYQCVQYEDPGNEFTEQQVLDSLASVFPALNKGKYSSEEIDGVRHVTLTDAPKKNG